MPASAPQFYPSVQSPTVTPVPEQYGGATTSLRVARPTLLPGSYVPGAYGHVLISPGVVPISGWSPYSVCQKHVLKIFLYSLSLCLLNMSCRREVNPTLSLYLENLCSGFIWIF